jgi:hypothetical protein
MPKVETTIEIGEANYVELVWKSNTKLQILKNGEHYINLSLLDGTWIEN